MKRAPNARRFRMFLAEKGIEIGKREIEDVPLVESAPRYNADDVAALEVPDIEGESEKRDAAE